MFGRVKNAKLFLSEGGHYFLDVRYETEDSEKVMEYHFPKVRLPIEYAEIEQSLSVINSAEPSEIKLVLPWADLPCYKGKATFVREAKDGRGRESINVPEVYFASCVIEEKTKEMTIAEIEKKLGHKVKIVESHSSSSSSGGF